MEFSIKAKKTLEEGTCGYGVDGKLGEEPEIDMYSKLPTKDDSSESSGLTKSGGSLSLDDKTKTMLKTRGMNAV